MCARGPVSVAAIILAAGGSSRLGQPKQLLPLAGEPLLSRFIRIAREAGCEPVIVVLGASAEAIADDSSVQQSLAAATVVVNFEWEEGIASSIRSGVAALRALSPHGLAGVLLMTCDQPAVTAAHLRALSASGALTASAYSGRSGVPAYFPAATLAALEQLTGDSGARTLLHTATAIPLAGGELDIDTPADLARLNQLSS